MSKGILGKIRNTGIVVLLVAVIAYCAFYWSGSSVEEEAAGEQIAIEGEVVPPVTQEQETEVQDDNGETKPEDRPEDFCDIMAVVAAGEVTRNIKMYVQDDMCFFFLPSYVDTQQAVWQYDEDKYTITCDGQAVKNGDQIADTGQAEAVLNVRQAGTDEGTEYRLRVMCSSKLPALYIDSDGQEPQAGAGRFLCVSETGETDSEGNFYQISHREYGEFQAAKKNYEIECETEQNILGMGGSLKWMLQANAYDLSRMRNKIVYDMAEDMGLSYGVDSSYVDVWLNGEYAGNYLICKENGKEEEREALQSFVDRSVDRVVHCGTEEEYRQLQEKIDLESFVRIYILSELANEPGLNRKSVFYLTPDPENSKLYAGLELDWDRSFGNAEGAHFERLTCFVPGQCEKLFECGYFRQDVVEKFNAQYAPVIERYVNQKIDGYAEQINDSVRMDEVRWSMPDENNYMDFNQSYATFEDAVRYTSYYMKARYELIRQYLNAPEQWHQVEFVNTALETGYDSLRYWVEDGAKIPDEVLAFLQETFGCDEWRYEDGRGCETGRPIYQDIRFLSYVEESDEQEVASVENQETEQEEGSAGYSKRFVIFCMLLAGGCAGVCGLLLGWGISVLFFRKRKDSLSESNKHGE